jgi:phage terminase large subunit-like protein
MLKSKEGQFILVGDYDEKTKDKNTSIMGRFWKRPGERDQYILDQAMKDGTDCTIILPVDPGAAGKTAFREMSKKFIEEGFVVKQDPTPNNKSKLKRFEPFSAAAQSGLISIVESTFSDETLEYIYKELENFDGERSSASKKDDICDATASVYSYLTTAKIIKPFKVPTIESDTKLHSYRNSIR